MAIFYTLCVLDCPAMGQSNVTTQPAGGQPLNITADRIDHLQEFDIYEAEGSVVVTQGDWRLTADHVTIRTLPGILIAVGHVRLSDPSSEATAERLELNVNTEAGIMANGTLLAKPSNSFVTGRFFQRFSEDHYRVKDGTFTNCDAARGETRHGALNSKTWISTLGIVWQ